MMPVRTLEGLIVPVPHEAVETLLVDVKVSAPVGVLKKVE
jgi:hypothetical protein